MPQKSRPFLIGCLASLSACQSSNFQDPPYVPRANVGSKSLARTPSLAAKSDTFSSSETNVGPWGTSPSPPAVTPGVPGVAVTPSPALTTQPKPVVTPSPVVVVTSSPKPVVTPTPSPTPVATSLSLPARPTFFYSINSTLNTNPSAKVVFVDLFDTSSSKITQLKNAGKIVICYFSGGTWEDWRSDKNSFPARAIGNEVDGWPHESWVDYRDSAIVQIMESRILSAKSKGCQGVDPDNIDGHTNDSGFSLSASSQSAYLSTLASYAHSHGLFIGLKNSAETAPKFTGKMDFAVVEECEKYSECGSYSGFVSARKPVFRIEYGGLNSSSCLSARAQGMQLVFANLELTSIQQCETN